MTLIESRDSGHPADNLICPRCSSSLLPHAIFCSTCGERIKKKNEEGEARTENGNDDAQGQKVVDTARLPSLSRVHLKGLRSYWSLKKKGMTRRTHKNRLLPADAESPTPEELSTLSLSVTDIDTQKQSAVPLSEQLEQPITQPLSIARATHQQIADTSGSNSDAMRRCSRLIADPWLLIRSLAHRIYNDSLLRNTIYMMSTTVVTAGFGYIYWIVAARIYPVRDVGLASALISIMTLTSTLANLGIGSTLVQVLPRRKAGYAWSLALNSGMATGIVTSLLAGAVIVIVLPLLTPQFSIFAHQTTYAFVFIVGVPLSTVATVLDQVFVAERAAGHMLVRNAVYAVLKLPLIVLPVLVAQGALGLLSSWVLALAATLLGAGLLLIPRLRRSYRLTMRGIVGQARMMLSSLVWQHFINIGGMAPMYLVPVFVAVRLSTTDNAYFYTTSRVSSFFFMISTAVATSLFAEGSHSAHDMLRKARFSALIIGILLIPALLTVWLAGHYILLLFGPDYAQHGLPLLRISTIEAVPDAITNIYVSMLRVRGRLRSAAILNLGMAILTLTLTWILLPVLGITGAAWAFVIAQLAGSLVAGADAIRMRHHRRRAGELAFENNSDSAGTKESYQ